MEDNRSLATMSETLQPTAPVMSSWMPTQPPAGSSCLSQNRSCKITAKRVVTFIVYAVVFTVATTSLVLGVVNKAENGEVKDEFLTRIKNLGNSTERFSGCYKDTISCRVAQHRTINYWYLCSTASKSVNIIVSTLDPVALWLPGVTICMIVGTLSYSKIGVYRWPSRL